MRRAGPALLLALLALAAPARTARAEPAKTYRVQETTRCAYAQGCARMLGNAVSHARSFCQAEGGVKKGGSKRDFACEQRGIYCVVSGRIECNGRLDPTRAPAPSGFETSRPIESPPTCLDAGCNKYVDHAPGRREDGLHACPPTHAMAGIAARGGDIVCQALPGEVLESARERGTERRHMRACPQGWLLRGISDDRSELLCSKPAQQVGSEGVQREAGDRGLQICADERGQPRYLAGVDGGRQALLCAPVAR